MLIQYAKQTTPILLSLTLLLAGCGQGSSKSDESSKDQEAKPDKSEQTTMESEMKTAEAVAMIQGKSGSALSGEVSFTEKEGKVTMHADLKNVMPAGNHAIHIHAKGDCSADDGTSAGGHWNPTNVDHGKWGTDPHHKGDIGNITSDTSGDATYEVTTDEWCLTCDDETKNILGKAIIIHIGPDDFTSQPSGAAGKRIGCGVIEMK